MDIKINLTMAESISELYQSLINNIPKEKLNKPIPTFRQENEFALQDMWLSEGYIYAKWSRYVGCGEWEKEETSQSLSDFFED
jgi:hypothetical protein